MGRWFPASCSGLVAPPIRRSVPAGERSRGGRLRVRWGPEGRRSQYPDDLRSPLDLPIEPLDGIVRIDLGPVVFREGGVWGARFAGDWLPSCYTKWGDATVRYNGLVLQILPSRDRYHYAKATIRVLEYHDERIALFHGSVA